MNTTNKIQAQPTSRIIRIVLLCLIVLILIVLGSVYLPPGIDWRDTYRPATLALLSGKSPFSIDIYFSAPWALVPLIPFALMPENLGRATLFLLGIGSFAFTAHHLGAKPLALMAFLLSPPVMHCLLNSNIEWLPLLGFIMPPQIGLFFIAIKPQIGIGVGLFWLIEAWRRGGFQEIVRVFWPVSLTLLISFAIFGLWPLRFSDTITLTRTYNSSFWPSSIPIGLTLLMASLRKRDIKYAMASSPCLSPYVLFHAWVGALVALVPQTAETIVAVIGLWILVAIRAFSGL